MSSGSPRLNSAGWLAQTFIESRLTSLFILASLVLGTVALALTPREETPQIQVAGALVSVPLPGAEPREVADLVVRPLEGMLHGMQGVDYTKGIAQAGMGSVQVLFKCGQRKEDALARVYERVQTFEPRLPAGAGRPVVQGMDTDSIPVFSVSLASEEMAENELLQLAQRLAEKLTSVDGVSGVEVRGGQAREVRIAVDPVRLQSYGISLDQLDQALRQANQAAFLENCVQEGRLRGVRADGWFRLPEDVGDLVVGVHGRRPVLLRDIADVGFGIPLEDRVRASRLGFGPADPRSLRFPGEMPAVTVAVAKKKGADATAVCRELKARLQGMEGSFLPDGVLAVVTRDDGAKASQAVNTLLMHLGIAILSVGAVLVPLLGWRDACIVMATVPVIFSLTLGADFLGGVTINRITLFALIIAMGLLVDGAIVVLENIHRHYERPCSSDKRAVAVTATGEVGNATTLATFAIMAVFASLLLVTGMPGDYFYPMAFNLPLCMLFSLVVAYMAVPWMARRFLPMAPCGDGTPPRPRRSRLQALYERTMTFLMASARRRHAFAAGTVLALAASLLMGGWQFVRPSGPGGAPAPLGVALGFLPKNNCDTFAMTLNMPEDTPLEQTDRCVRDLGRLLAGHPMVADYESWVGFAGVMDFSSMLQGTAMAEGPHFAEIRVNLIGKRRRSATSIEIVRALRPQAEAVLARYPGARLRMVEDPPGPPMQATVSAQIYGPDAEGLRTVAKQVEAEFARTWDMVDISTTETVDVPEYRLRTDKVIASLSGVSESAVVQGLQWVYGGWTAGRLHRQGEREAVPLRIAAPRRSQPDPRRLDQLSVRSSSGALVPLSTLVAAETGLKPRPVQSRNAEETSRVDGELASSAQVYAVLDLDRRLEGMPVPDGGRLRTGGLSLVEDAPSSVDGYLLLWGGEMRCMLDVYRDLLTALGAALALVYLLLTAYYKSFLVPVLAMASIPLGLIGIFPGHWLLGVDFSAASIIGIIALSGIAVRNSLLIIDFTQEILETGRPVRLAAMEAGSIRLKPIAMTTLAIGLGSLIMVKDPVFGGLSISLIFGTCSSTLLTLLAVPLLCVKFAYSLRARS